MSKSYKKTPLFCDRNPWMKKYANRRFRRHTNNPENEIQNGRWYSRYTEPWDICDYKSGCFTKNKVLQNIDEGKNPPIHKQWYSKGYYTPLYRYYMK